MSTFGLDAVLGSTQEDEAEIVLDISQLTGGGAGLQLETALNVAGSVTAQLPFLEGGVPGPELPSLPEIVADPAVAVEVAVEVAADVVAGVTGALPGVPTLPVVPMVPGIPSLPTLPGAELPSIPQIVADPAAAVGGLRVWPQAWPQA